MELSEIIEKAVAQAVADREAESQLSAAAAAAKPPRLVEVSPEPVAASQETKKAKLLQKGRDLAVYIARGANQTVQPDSEEPQTPAAPSVATEDADPAPPVQVIESAAIAEPSDPAAPREADVSTQTETADPEESSLAGSPADALSPFRALVRRSYLQEPAEPVSEKAAYNPLDFYADVRFIPVMVTRLAFQILQLNPALREPSIHQSHTLVSHGTFSHTWSLLPLGSSLARSESVIRPIGVLQTYGKGIPLADAVVKDYAYAWRAQSVHLRHYVDSWAVSGTHTAFQVCKDYVFEWKPVEFPQGSGTFELYLWRHSVEEGSVSPAARICESSPIRSPIDDSELWSLEVDVDKIAPHVALLTAFAIKLPSAAIHSWFAPKEMVVPLPMPLVNFAFQDDGHVYQRLEKFYGDWEDSRIRHLQDAAEAAPPSNGSSSALSEAEVRNISLVRVFKREFINQYAFPDEAVELLNTEAKNYLEAIKSKFGIH